MSKQEQVAALREAAQSAKKQVPVPVPYSPRALPGRHSLGECGGVRVFDDYEPVRPLWQDAPPHDGRSAKQRREARCAQCGLVRLLARAGQLRGQTRPRCTDERWR